MKRGYKYRIYPNEEQQVEMAHNFGCNRWWWNYQLDKVVTRQEEYKRLKSEGATELPGLVCITGKKENGALTSLLPSMKKDEETTWLKEADSTSLIITSRTLDASFKDFLKGAKGFPKFKARGRSDTYTVQVPTSAQFNNILKKKGGKWFINIGKTHMVLIRLHRKCRGGIKSITVSRTPKGDYYASILVDDTFQPLPQRQHTDEGTIGVDMGSKYDENNAAGGNAILSDGTRFPVINITREEQLLKRLQKRLSKKEWKKTGEIKPRKKYNKETKEYEIVDEEVKTPSKNYLKLKHRIAKIHERIKRRRNYNTHQISSYIAKNDNIDTVGVETLNVKGMQKNHKNARSISNGAMGELQRQLEYKCQWNGKTLIKVPWNFASTKTCRICGNKTDVGSKRIWKCPHCGTVHDRDINAAINIKEEALRIIHNPGQAI